MSHHEKIYKKLEFLFKRVDAKIIKVGETEIDAEIYGMKYFFQENDNFIVFIRENDPEQVGIIDDNVLDGAVNIVAPYLKYFDRLESKEIPKHSIVPEKSSDPAVLSFFMCPGDCYICYENSFCAAPMINKAQTLCAVDGTH